MMQITKLLFLRIMIVYQTKVLKKRKRLGTAFCGIIFYDDINIKKYLVDHYFFSGLTPVTRNYSHLNK